MSNLTAWNKTAEKKALEVLMREFSLGVVDYTTQEIRAYLYVTRKYGGRGMLRMEASHNPPTYRTSYYININAENDTKLHYDRKTLQYSKRKRGRRIAERYVDKNVNTN